MATFRLSGGDLTLPTASVGDEQIKTPGSNEVGVGVAKLRHLFKPSTNFGNHAIGSSPSNLELILFVAATGGTIRGVKALLWDTGTTGQVNYDLKVNGVSVLAATFNVNSSDADRAIKDGSINSPNFNAGDVISISQSVAGSDGTGPFAWVEVEENAG